VVTLIVIYQYQKGHEFSLPSWSNVKKKEDTKNSRVFRSKVLLDVGEKTNLGIKMAIPCANGEQLLKLKHNLRQIRNDFLIGQDQRELETLVRERNFSVIKQKLLRVVNNYVDEPVKDLYFEEFLVE